MSKILSVIIPARNEFPNIAHTVHSIINCLEADGFSHKDFEIIIVDNGSTDNSLFPQRGTRGTTNYLMPRGIYYSGTLRVHYDPICGNHSARNKGARIAQGKYLFFSDAHMSYRPGFFKHILKAVDESGGIVHGVIAWMGAYPVHSESGAPHGLGFQYTMKMGEEIKGTWAPYCLSNDHWFYIAAQGHCSVAVRRDQFLNFGGYPEIHRTYGGGEFYLNMKWWMYGSSVAVEPKAIGYHLASGRGYSYNHDDYIHNVMNIGIALGMDDWVERFYINCLRRGRKEVIDRMWKEAWEETKKDRELIAKSRRKTFNTVLAEETWNKLNEKKFGKSNGGILIYHDTWLKLLETAPEYAKEAYRNSKHQKELAAFINTKLAHRIYKRGKMELNEFKDDIIIAPLDQPANG